MLIGSDFIRVELPRISACSECGVRIPAGQPSLESRSKKNGKCMKRICTNEQCRLNFDDRFWQAAATHNQKRRRAA